MDDRFKVIAVLVVVAVVLVSLNFKTRSRTAVNENILNTIAYLKRRRWYSTNTLSTLRDFKSDGSITSRGVTDAVIRLYDDDYSPTNAAYSDKGLIYQDDNVSYNAYSKHSSWRDTQEQNLYLAVWNDAKVVFRDLPYGDDIRFLADFDEASKNEAKVQVEMIDDLFAALDQDKDFQTRAAMQGSSLCAEWSAFSLCQDSNGSAVKMIFTESSDLMLWLVAKTLVLRTVYFAMIATDSYLPLTLVNKFGKFMDFSIPTQVCVDPDGGVTGGVIGGVTGGVTGGGGSAISTSKSTSNPIDTLPTTNEEDTDSFFKKNIKLLVGVIAVLIALLVLMGGNKN
jgi:hypothetical protein